MNQKCEKKLWLCFARNICKQDILVAARRKSRDETLANKLETLQVCCVSLLSLPTSSFPP